MKDILKTLMKFKWKILLVLFLLLCQAYCNLTLPEYISNIVNIGISREGVENIVPEVMTKETYNKLLNLVDDEDKNTINENYICNKNNEYKTDVCTLKSIDESTKINLESILIYPLITLTEYENTSETSNINLVEKVKNDYKDNESLFQDKIINYIINEYETVGLDLNEKSMSYIYKTGFKMVIITLIGLLFTISSMYLTSKIASDFGRDLRKKLVNKIMSLESEEISDFSIASLITRCTNDIIQVQNSIFIILRIVVFAPIMAVGASIKVSNNPMGWIIIFAVIVILSLMLLLFLIVVPKFKKFQDLLDKLNLVSRETLTGLPVIRGFANLKYEENKFESVNEDLTKNGLFVMKSMAVMSPTLTFLMNSISILIVWVGASHINNGQLQVGDLIAFITYTMQIIMAFLMVSMVAIMLPRMIVSFKRISELFNTKTRIKEKKKPIKLENIKGHIEFKNVSFKYPSSDVEVLKNINFEIKPGTTTAFIGSTGSGKSTLINLIPRFFDVTNGQILIDGIDIRDVSIKNLRGLIGYVPQKGWLASGTIEENIAYGLTKIDKEVVEASAKISESLEFIKEKEDEFSSLISAGGTNVSGGQRARLSIARAIAKNPSILIFDDSFSALDYKTESLIRASLNKKLKDKTILLVSSRISSVMHADQIVVLNEGEIVGIGTHEELLESCEVYKEIKMSTLGGED